MKRHRPRLSPLLLVLFVSGHILQACATTGQPEPMEKIGMHIDAVLDFAIEYPLAWKKDRRVAYGSKQGEVRWTDPGHPDMLFKVRSALLQQPASAPEQQIDDVLRQYTGLEVTLEEKVTLPAGEAWKVTGHTDQIDLGFYLVNHGPRGYLITIKVARGSFDNFRDMLSRLIESFQVLQ